MSAQTAIPELHPRLAADCHLIGRVPSGRLLLSRQAALHWFILVPDVQATDLLDLPAQALAGLMADAAAVSAVLKQGLGYPKVNMGALGNVVPQLHLHVIGRRPGDFCWPDPVWGRSGPPADWPAETLAALRERLTALGILVGQTAA